MSTIVQRLKTNLSKRRQKKVSGEKKKCISCDKIYSRRKGLHVHLNSDHQPTFCERIFSCLKYDWNPQLCLTNLFVNDIVVNKAKSEAIFINFVGVTFAHEDDQLTRRLRRQSAQSSRRNVSRIIKPDQHRMPSIFIKDLTRGWAFSGCRFDHIC